MLPHATVCYCCSSVISRSTLINMTSTQHSLKLHLTILQQTKVGLHSLLWRRMCVSRTCSCISFYLYHLSDIAFRTRVFSGIFDFHQHNKEQVVPHVVFLFYVLLKSHCLVVKFVTFQACRPAKTHITYGKKWQRKKIKRRQLLVSVSQQTFTLRAVKIKET